MLNDLSEFIQSNPDPRNWNERSQFKCFSTATNIERFREPRYKFRVHQQMDSNVWTVGCSWIKTGIPWVGRLSRGATATGHHLAPDQNYWNLAELQGYATGVRCSLTLSKATTACLKKLGLAGKTQKRNPKKDPELVKKKTRDYRLVRSPSCPDCLWAVGGLLRRWMPPAMGRSLAMFGVNWWAHRSSHHQWTQANLLWSR